LGEVPRPLVGISAAVEPASFGPWVEEPSVLLPVGYARAVQAAGGVAAMLPPDAGVAEAPDEILDRLDALILGGGADVDPARYDAEPEPRTGPTNPGRDRFELALARRALERDLPLLGVCRGGQILNVATGGSLVQHLPDRLGHDRHRPVPGSWSEHQVRLAPGSLAARAAGAERLSVKTHHHQGLARIGAGLEQSGWADEGETVEALESADHRFVLGVLWHPEEGSSDRVIPAIVKVASP
jgi:putative glutamine amidotransferase